MGKMLYFIALLAPQRFMVARKWTTWSCGSYVPSFLSFGIFIWELSLILTCWQTTGSLRYTFKDLVRLCLLGLLSISISYFCVIGINCSTSNSVFGFIHFWRLLANKLTFTFYYCLRSHPCCWSSFCSRHSIGICA